jgi:hypothetical protein
VKENRFGIFTDEQMVTLGHEYKKLDEKIKSLEIHGRS